MQLINVDLGDGRIFPMESHLLDGPHVCRVETIREIKTVTRYRYRGKVVHESAHIHLKQGLTLESIFGSIG